MKLRTLMTAAFSLFLASSATAQSGTSQKMTIQAGYGTVTMGGVQWQRFSFRPDIPVGNFGIGLDLELFIDNEGKISDEGWNFSNRNQVWDTLIRKIYYVRYGKPFDRFYLRAGALDDVTLGYGLVMEGYRNTLNYPADKKLGVDMEIRDVGTFGIDIHGVVNSVGDFKNRGAVAGGRIAFKPLKPSGASFLGKLTVGATLVRDINQFAGLKDSDDDGYPDFQDGFPDDGKRWADTDGDGFEDEIDIDIDGDNILDTNDPVVERQNYINIKEEQNGVTVYGFDVGIPLVENPVRLDLYGQFSRIHTGDEEMEGGWGIGAPGFRFLAGKFKAQVEYRHFEGPFIPSYFDNLYEHERVRLVGTTPLTKESSLVDETLRVRGLQPARHGGGFRRIPAHGGRQEFQRSDGYCHHPRKHPENDPEDFTRGGLFLQQVCGPGGVQGMGNDSQHLLRNENRVRGDARHDRRVGHTLYFLPERQGRTRQAQVRRHRNRNEGQVT